MLSTIFKQKALSNVIAKSKSSKSLVKLAPSATFNLSLARGYWWKKDDDGPDGSGKKGSPPTANEDPTEPIVVEDVPASSGSYSSGSGSRTSTTIVPQFGDSTPRPSSVLTIPIPSRPLIPGFVSTVHVSDPKTCEYIQSNVAKGRQYAGLFLRADKGKNIDVPELITNLSQVYNVGTFASINSAVKTANGGLQLFIMGHRRLSLNEITTYGPPIMSNVTHWKRNTSVESTPAIKAYCNEILASVRELIKINPLAQEHLQSFINRVELSDPYKLADFAAAITTASGENLQKILKSTDVEERLHLALELLTEERELAKLQRDISKSVEDRMNKQQREYFLREQLKSIKNELGIEKEDKDELAEKFQTKFDEFKSKEFKNKKEITKVIGDEIKKLTSLEKNSPEFNVTKSYLDWLTSIPHGHTTQDKLNLQEAAKTLDVDHYGLEEIKKIILEFIAVGKLNGTVSGKIICFIGPPGVGKTSIAKSIAAALNRQFYRFSVGGLTDIAEVKGHRRTYIGAMPGKPVLCLKSTGCMNPLILIDEIDKLGRGSHQGDPASALLELLDPNQNNSFMDHYLDVPLDFSNVLFVCTANDEGSIPGPLRDRMEIIRLSGYDIPEKIAIASKYLVPKAMKEAGLLNVTNFNAEITHSALESLVKNYCRESGVRNLEKHIEKMTRKIAYDVVGKLETTNSPDIKDKSTVKSAESSVAKGAETETETEADEVRESSDSKPSSEVTEVKHSHLLPDQVKITITDENIEKYVGKKKFTHDNIYESDRDEPLPVGIVMGLAWNPMGGSPVFIESAALPITFTENGGGINSVTGQLGSVMKESVTIAYTFSRGFIAEKYPDNKFFKSHSIHIHVPEGAVEKDGPSAGITMATSLISKALNRPVKARIAMTGELSLTGKVLPVGGIKEKTLAARRSGANMVILPVGCKRDFDELPQYVKDSVKIHFVSEYSEVFDLVFDKN